MGRSLDALAPRLPDPQRSPRDSGSWARSGPTRSTDATRSTPSWQAPQRAGGDRAPEALRPGGDGGARRRSSASRRSGVIDDVFRRSGGNPFFAEELLAEQSTEQELPDSLRSPSGARRRALGRCAAHPPRNRRRRAFRLSDPSGRRDGGFPAAAGGAAAGSGRAARDHRGSRRPGRGPLRVPPRAGPGGRRGRAPAGRAGTAPRGICHEPREPSAAAIRLRALSRDRDHWADAGDAPRPSHRGRRPGAEEAHAYSRQRPVRARRRALGSRGGGCEGRPIGSTSSPVPPPARTPCRRATATRSPWLVERSRLLPRILCDPASCTSASADTRCWPRAPTSPMTPTARRCVSSRPIRRPRARPGGGGARASTSRAATTRPRPSSRPRRSIRPGPGAPQIEANALITRCGCRLALGMVEAAEEDARRANELAAGIGSTAELPDPCGTSPRSLPSRGSTTWRSRRACERSTRPSGWGWRARRHLRPRGARRRDAGAGRWSDADAVLRRMERVGISGYHANTFHWVREPRDRTRRYRRRRAPHDRPRQARRR